MMWTPRELTMKSIALAYRLPDWMFLVVESDTDRSVVKVYLLLSDFFVMADPCRNVGQTIVYCCWCSFLFYSTQDRLRSLSRLPLNFALWSEMWCKFKNWIPKFWVKTYKISTILVNFGSPHKSVIMLCVAVSAVRIFEISNRIE